MREFNGYFNADDCNTLLIIAHLLVWEYAGVGVAGELSYSVLRGNVPLRTILSLWRYLSDIDQL